MTPLERIIRAQIAAEGPMALDRYMALCLGHPQHGYYMTRDPLGSKGDFTTAPEISQVFGELVGVWCAQIWQQLDSPARFSLVELGPGRGTLMRDALRATQKIKGFHDAVEIHLVETSPVLRAVQRQAVEHAVWHDTVATLPQHPTIVIGNEFFDALPIKQYDEANAIVRERVVELTDDTLAFGLDDTQIKSMGKDGLFEVSPARIDVAVTLGLLIAMHGGAALVIDYGHRKSAMGDTLQAMKDHRYCSIFETPGEADITSHVDFEQIGAAFAAAKTTVHPVLTQRDFLTGMGLSLRAEVLARKLVGAEKDVFLEGVRRLADDTEMGQLFKVMAVTRAEMPVPYPFGET
jgi:NADH dehydrogenase [ubiquinone] 1 alpha subcomplex assembly factor 7